MPSLIKTLIAILLLAVLSPPAFCDGGFTPGGLGLATTVASVREHLRPAEPVGLDGGRQAVRPDLRSVGHIFVIVLENKGFLTTFGEQSPAHYLGRELPARGALLRRYYGIGHSSLPNYIAMISGQAPNPQTQANCQRYSDFIATGVAAHGQAIGTGCVFPPQVASLPDQFAAAGVSWKGYMEDMGNDPAREASACGHPASNARDNTQVAQAPSARVPGGDAYAMRHNPFMYFHAVTDAPTCAEHVVRLDTLPRDLKKVETTPRYAFIAPNLCHDGHDAPCANGEAGRLVSADAFLRKWVALITASPAFEKDGLLMIVFDESDSPADDSTACCGEIPGPNAAQPGRVGPGGGRTGAVLLSRFIRPGTVSDRPYNHYSQLKSVETSFDLPLLGYAGVGESSAFGADVLTGTP